MLITFWQTDNWQTQKIITGDLNACKVFPYSVSNSGSQILFNALTSQIISIQKLINAFVLTKEQIFVIPAWGNGQIIYLSDLQGKNSLQNLILALSTTKQACSALLTNNTQWFSNSFIAVGAFQNFSLSLLHNQHQQILNLLIVNESKRFVNSLIIRESHAKFIPIPFETYQFLLTELKDRLLSTQILLSAIAHAGLEDTQSLTTSLQQEQVQRLVSEIKQGLLQTQQLELGIDSYQGAIQALVNALVRWGILDTQTISLAIEKDSHVLTQQITVLLDGQDITGKVLEGNINVYGNGILSDFSLSLKSDSILSGAEVEIQIEGQIYKFLLEENSYNAKDKIQSFWGRAKSASLYEPLAVKKDYKFKNQMASQIVAQVCKGYSVDWQIDDWLIPVYEKEDAYPLDVVKEIVDAAGACIRATPDSVIHIVYPYFDDGPSISADLPISATYKKQIKQADGVKVNFGRNETVVLEADKTEVKPNEWAEIKVYCTSEYEIQCGADVCYLVEEGVYEEVEEEVVCENGRGSLSKPVVEIIENDGAEIYGQEVYIDGCKIAKIRYKTKYDLWKITNYTEAKKFFCCVATENSYTMLEGTGERIEEIDSPLSSNSYIARRRAEKELMERKGLPVVSLTIPFEPDVVNPAGCLITTPFGIGMITKSTIVFTSNPCKILNNLEVLLCPH